MRSCRCPSKASLPRGLLERPGTDLVPRMA
nr:MAG TPA: hypothetical protein [Caudoviricetes sp.]